MNSQPPMSGMPDLYAGDRKRQVLIVEDEFVNRELLNAYLENDYELLFAETGAEALETIRAHSETLSLVLLDLILPDINGLDILRRIKQDADLTRIPIIVLTSDTESEVESLNTGASDFISKPYPRHEVIMARTRRSIELSENRDLIRWTERDHLTGLFNRDYFYRYAEQYDLFHAEEPTDALVLIVSEETGIISMARAGKLTRYLDEKSIRETLSEVYKTGSTGSWAALKKHAAKYFKKGDKSQ